jgi:hypothetical protein
MTVIVHKYCQDCRDWYGRFTGDVLAAVDERRFLPVDSV